MEEKEELVYEAKKKNKAKSFLRFLGVAITVIGIGLKLYDFYSSRELQHYFESGACITNLTSSEQKINTP